MSDQHRPGTAESPKEHRNRTEDPGPPDEAQAPEEPGQTPDSDPPPTSPRSNPDRDEGKVKQGVEDLERVVGN